MKKFAIVLAALLLVSCGTQDCEHLQQGSVADRLSGRLDNCKRRQ